MNLKRQHYRNKLEKIFQTTISLPTIPQLRLKTILHHLGWSSIMIQMSDTVNSLFWVFLELLHHISSNHSFFCPIIFFLVSFPLSIHREPTHYPVTGQSFPLDEQIFYFSIFTVNRSELFAPVFRYRCSVLRYPFCFKSSIARLTVDFDIERSLAILRSDGQHFPSLFALCVR